MPYINDWNSYGLHRSFFGCVTGEEIFQANLILQRDQRFLCANYIINNFTDMTGHTLTEADAHLLANTDNIIADIKGPLNIAIIVVNEEQRLLAQNYVDLMDGSVYCCRIFNQLSDAHEWLDILL